MRVKWNARRSVAAKPVAVRSTRSVDPAGGSSSGRTADSDSANLGSNPSPPATTASRATRLGAEAAATGNARPAGAADDQQVGGTRRKQSDRDHAGNLIDGGLHRHRIGDPQIVHIQNVV